MGENKLSKREKSGTESKTNGHSQNGDTLKEDPKQNRGFITQIGMFLLIVVCHTGNNYGSSQDIVVETDLESHYGISNSMFNQLFFFKIMGILASGIFGGRIIDKLGFNRAFSLFIHMTLLGQIFSVIGIYSKMFIFHLLTRFFCGSAELISSFNITFYTRWFREDQLSTILGLAYCYSRSFKSLSLLINSYLAQQYGVSAPYIVCLLICILGAALSYVANMVDEKIGEQNVDKSKNEKKDKKNGSACNDFASLPLGFWLVFLCSAFGFLTIYGMHMNQSKFYQLHYNFSAAEAGLIVSLNAITCTVASPFVGMFLAKTKNRIQWLTISAIMFITSHAYFAFGPNPDQSYAAIIPNIVIALANCIMVVLFPTCVKEFVSMENFTKAMVVFQMNEKLGMLFNPTITGLIIDNTTSNHGFFGVSLVLMLYATLMLATCLMLSSERFSGLLKGEKKEKIKTS